MQHKFWFSYLALVLLLSGLAYVAISDDTDVPLALSDSEMAVLHATGTNEKCWDFRPGCNTSSCDPTYYDGRKRRALNIRKCYTKTGYICRSAGLSNAQESCVVTLYTNHCQDKGRTYRERTYDCVDEQM